MTDINTFKKGDQVTFRPGRANASVTAKVTGTSECGRFLVTTDAAGYVRKTRPGACVLAA